MLRAALFATVAAVFALSGVSLVRSGPGPQAPAEQKKPPQSRLPISRVVLFSSGVGYFQRDGDVDGDAAIDLQFPTTDVNDLIKSLVVEDTGGGKIVAVNYDSPDPIQRTLRTFAIDLTTNPSLGELLNQARGEPVEIAMLAATAGSPDTLNGTIVGMESQRQSPGKDGAVDADFLNLLSAEGLRSLPLSRVQRVRFLNPNLDADLKRALSAISGSRNHEKKTVSFQFRGPGRRGVRVGYVVESPMWKASYRLALDGGNQAQLRGWAIVENTSDDDWTNVRMALVSGRPISYRMELYEPLFVPRPLVEPEIYASLRPPTYGGALTNLGAQGALGGLGLGGAPFQGALGFAGGNNATNLGGEGQSNLGFAPFNRYQPGGQLGFSGGNSVPVADLANANFNSRRLTFEELQKRKQQKPALTNVNTQVDENEQPARPAGVLDPSVSVASVAAAGEVGQVCRYSIDERVTLPRQKSTMLPIVSQGAEVKKLSIYNESVHARHPLLGLRFKNVSAQPLMQGPMTIFDADGYAGDSRIPDLQPGEERLLSYALDLGVEVKAEGRGDPQTLSAVRAVKGTMHITHRYREGRTYWITNRSTQDRTVLVEHPLRESWKLVAPASPAERSRDVYRFAVAVPAGRTERLDVMEERLGTTQVVIGGLDEPALRLLLKNAVPSARMKEALEKLIVLRARSADLSRESAALQQQLKSISEDQARLRANFEKMPPNSAAYKRYLEKFDVQETEIEKLRADLAIQQTAEKKAEKDLEDYVAGLNIEA